MTRITAAVMGALCAAALAVPATAQTSDVTVIRGGGGAPTARVAAVAGVDVVRGAPVAAARSPARAADAVRAAYGATGQQALARQPFAAGDTLWFHDADTGRLTACWVAGSGYVGVSVIRCTDRHAY